jgi:hypothetical protein
MFLRHGSATDLMNRRRSTSECRMDSPPGHRGLRLGGRSSISTARLSLAAFVAWAFATDQPHRDRLGRTAMPNGCRLNPAGVSCRRRPRRARTCATSSALMRSIADLSLVKDEPIPRVVQTIGSILPLPVLSTVVPSALAAAWYPGA